MKTAAETRLKLRRPPSAPRDEKSKPDKKTDRKDDSCDKLHRKTGIGLLKPTADRPKLVDKPKKPSRQRVPLEDLKEAKAQQDLQLEQQQEEIQKEQSAEQGEEQRLGEEAILLFSRRQQFEEKAKPILQSQLNQACSADNEFEQGEPLDQLTVNDFVAQFYEGDGEDSPRQYPYQIAKLQSLKKRVKSKLSFMAGQNLDTAQTKIALQKLKQCEEHSVKREIQNFIAKLEEHVLGISRSLQKHKLPPLTQKSIGQIAKTVQKSGELRQKADAVHAIKVTDSTTVVFVLSPIPYLRSAPTKVKALGFQLELPKIALHKPLLTVIVAREDENRPEGNILSARFQLRIFELTRLKGNPFGLKFEGLLNPNLRELKSEGQTVRIIGLKGEVLLHKFNGAVQEVLPEGQDCFSVTWPSEFQVVLYRLKRPFYQDFFIKLLSFEECMLQLKGQHSLKFVVSDRGVVLADSDCEQLQGLVGELMSWSGLLRQIRKRNKFIIDQGAQGENCLRAVDNNITSKFAFADTALRRKGAVVLAVKANTQFEAIRQEDDMEPWSTIAVYEDRVKLIGRKIVAQYKPKTHCSLEQLFNEERESFRSSCLQRAEPDFGSMALLVNLRGVIISLNLLSSFI